MKILIVCVGKIKEKFYEKAVDEYVKRLGRYARIEIRQVRDEPVPENRSAVETQQILEAEGERILKKLSDARKIYTLEIEGEELSSEQFSGKLAGDMGSGMSTIAFVIGGSLGLSESVMRASDGAISFSRMTFPHQLMRVILLEQIYRGFRIMRNEPYHK